MPDEKNSQIEKITNHKDDGDYRTNLYRSLCPQNMQGVHEDREVKARSLHELMNN